MSYPVKSLFCGVNIILIYIKCWVPFQKVWRLLNIFMPDYTWIENWLLLGLSSDEIVHERWLVQKRYCEIKHVLAPSKQWIMHIRLLWSLQLAKQLDKNNKVYIIKYATSKNFCIFLKNFYGCNSNHFWNSVFFPNRGFEKCKTEIFRIGGNFVLICSLHVMFKTDECRVWLSQRFLPLQSPPFKSKQQQSVGKRGQYQTLTCIPNDPWQILPMG